MHFAWLRKWTRSVKQDAKTSNADHALEQFHVEEEANTPQARREPGFSNFWKKVATRSTVQEARDFNATSPPSAKARTLIKATMATPESANKTTNAN